jgi:hypothetical protein
VQQLGHTGLTGYARAAGSIMEVSFSIRAPSIYLSSCNYVSDSGRGKQGLLIIADQYLSHSWYFQNLLGPLLLSSKVTWIRIEVGGQNIITGDCSVLRLTTAYQAIWSGTSFLLYNHCSEPGMAEATVCDEDPGNQGKFCKLNKYWRVRVWTPDPQVESSQHCP